MKSQGQRGVALVTALLVVSIATVAAVAMANRQQLDTRRTGSLLHNEQAWAYVLGAENWARVVLRRDAADSKIDTLAEDCGKCDGCLDPVETWDGLEAAQKLLSPVYRTGQRFGDGATCRARHQRLTDLGLGGRQSNHASQCGRPSEGGPGGSGQGAHTEQHGQLSASDHLQWSSPKT